MHKSLTRQIKTLLAGICLSALGSTALQAGEGLQSAEAAQYLSELKRLYLSSDDRQALLAHGNSLLHSYALLAGYQPGRTDAVDLRYQLSSPQAGELRVREERRTRDGSLQVSNKVLPVFGVDPFIRYECPQQGQQCVILDPRDGSPLLSIVRDHQGAAELAKALSYLLRNLQK